MKCEDEAAISLEKLKETAAVIVDRYVDRGAAERARFGLRTPLDAPDGSPWRPQSALHAAAVLVDDVNTMNVDGESPRADPFAAPPEHAVHGTEINGDYVLSNTILLNCDVLTHMELTRAISDGDPGRVLRTLWARRRL